MCSNNKIIQNESLNTIISSKSYLLLEGKNCPLSIKKMKFAELLMDRLNYTNIVSGDAGDEHKLKVGRFRRDIEFPIDLDPASKDLMKIINSGKMKNFYKKLTGFNETCIRRAQANVLDTGDYVGIHIDGEGDEKYKGTHKDYKYAVVLHFGLAYEGGDTIIYPIEKRKALRLPEYSMLIITGSLPHEVSPISKGKRKTIAYFLSDNFGHIRQ